MLNGHVQLVTYVLDILGLDMVRRTDLWWCKEHLPRERDMDQSTALGTLVDCMCICYLSCCCGKKLPKKSNLRKEVSVWVHSLIRDVIHRGGGNVEAGGCSRWSHCIQSGTECEQEVGLGYKPLRLTLSDPLPPERGPASFAFHVLGKQHQLSRPSIHT